MMVTCYNLLLHNTPGQNYYVISDHTLEPVTFIQHVRECILAKRYVPSGVWEAVMNENETTPLVCLIQWSKVFPNHQVAEEYVDQLLRKILQKDSGPEPLQWCVNLRELQETIKRLRYSLTVHSGLYYDHNVNMISDEEWDDRARQLVELQRRYPELIRRVGFFDHCFDDFRGETGIHLPWRDPGLHTKIYQLGQQWGLL